MNTFGVGRGISFRKALIGLLVLAWLPFVTHPAQAGKSYHAERYDVALAVQSGGTMTVTETVVFQFEGGPFTYVFRDLETTGTDRIDSLAASLDGRILPEGSGPGQVEIQEGSPIRITWHFSPTSNETHTFGLSYRVLGVVRQNSTDSILWRAVPETHDYEIGASQVTLQYPPSAVLVSAPDARVETGARQITWTAQSIRANTPLTISASFEKGSLVQAPPLWQAQQEQQARQSAQAAPLGVGAGLLALALGIGGLVWFLHSQRRENYLPPAPGMLQSIPPAQIAPALAARLAGGQSPAMATLFDLAHRGLLSVEESKGTWGSKVYTLYRQPAEAPLEPHEQVLLQALYASGKVETDHVKLSEAVSRLASRQSSFKQALEGEMARAGWIDLARRASRNRLILLSVIVDLLGLVGLSAGLVLGGVAGGAGNGPLLSLAAGLAGAGAGAFLAGLAGLIAAAVYSPLSNEGERQAAAWRGFAAYLKQAARAKGAALRPDLFELYLPYAAGFGIAGAWAKAFKKLGNTPVPAWFHALEASRQAADFDAVAVFVSASSSSFGGGDGGGGGAGASGGGASGAG